MENSNIFCSMLFVSYHHVKKKGLEVACGLWVVTLIVEQDFLIFFLYARQIKIVIIMKLHYF